MANRAAAPRGSRYKDQRRYVVAVSLKDLHGPPAGQVDARAGRRGLRRLQPMTVRSAPTDRGPLIRS